MNEYIQSIRFDKNLIRQDPMSGINHLTEKFAVKVTDMQNKAIVQAVRETAEKHGVTNLLIIDENFILEAIEAEIERRSKI